MGFARRFGLAEASSGTLASARDGVGAGNKAPTGGYLSTALLCAVYSHIAFSLVVDPIGVPPRRRRKCR